VGVYEVALTTNITLTEFYDVNSHYGSADPAPTNGDDTWGNYSLAVNETMNITVTVRTAERLANGTTIRNEVMVTCDQGTDIIHLQNTEITAPVFEVNITDDPDPVQEGTTTNLTVRVTNIGETHATNARVFGTYHSKMSYVTADPAPDSGNNYWAVGKLRPARAPTSPSPWR